MTQETVISFQSHKKWSRKQCLRNLGTTMDIRTLEAAVRQHEWSQFHFIKLDSRISPYQLKKKQLSNQAPLVMLPVHVGQSLLLWINRMRACPTRRCIWGHWLNGLGTVVESSRTWVKWTTRLIVWFTCGRSRWWAGCPCCPKGCHMWRHWWRLMFQGQWLWCFTPYNETSHNHLIVHSKPQSKRINI